MKYNNLLEVINGKEKETKEIILITNKKEIELLVKITEFYKSYNIKSKQVEDLMNTLNNLPIY